MNASLFGPAPRQDAGCKNSLRVSWVFAHPKCITETLQYWRTVFLDGGYQDVCVFSNVERGKHIAWSMILKMSAVQKILMIMPLFWHSKTKPEKTSSLEEEKKLKADTSLYQLDVSPTFMKMSTDK